MIKRILLSVGILILMGFAVQYYLFNKPHRDIAKAKEDFTLTATDFYAEYSSNEEASNAKYLEKVIELKGKVVEIQLENEEEPTVAIATAEEGTNVRCGFKKELLSEILKIKIGDSIKIKGRCDGMDMFGIVLTQCSLIE